MFCYSKLTFAKNKKKIPKNLDGLVRFTNTFRTKLADRFGKNFTFYMIEAVKSKESKLRPP